MEILDEDNHENETISNFAVGEMKSTFPWMIFVGITNIILYAINIFSFIVNGSGILSIVVLGLIISANIILLVSALNFRSFTNSGNLSDLEDALEKQKQYWQFMSFFAIAFLIILVLMFLFYLSR